VRRTLPRAGKVRLEQTWFRYRLGACLQPPGFHRYRASSPRHVQGVRRARRSEFQVVGDPDARNLAGTIGSRNPDHTFHLVIKYSNGNPEFRHATGRNSDNATQSTVFWVHLSTSASSPLPQRMMFTQTGQCRSGRPRMRRSRSTASCAAPRISVSGVIFAVDSFRMFLGASHRD